MEHFVQNLDRRTQPCIHLRSCCVDNEKRIRTNTRAHSDSDSFMENAHNCAHGQWHHHHLADNETALTATRVRRRSRPVSVAHCILIIIPAATFDIGLSVWSRTPDWSEQQPKRTVQCLLLGWCCSIDVRHNWLISSKMCGSMLGHALPIDLHLYR